MARRTDGEKIDELDKVTVSILTRLIAVEATLEQLIGRERINDRAAVESRMTAEREVALLKRECDELRRWTERNGTTDVKADVGLLKDRTAKVEATQDKVAARAWSVVPNVVGAVVNGALAAAVAYLVARR